MFGFRKLDVYQHALELVTREEVEPVEEMLVRIVAMLTKMAAR